MKLGMCRAKLKGRSGVSCRGDRWMGGLLFRIIPMPLYAQFTRQYNTTLLPSVNTIALGIFCGTKYTHHTNWCLFLYVGLVSSFLDFDVPSCRVSVALRPFHLRGTDQFSINCTWFFYAPSSTGCRQLNGTYHSGWSSF